MIFHTNTKYVFVWLSNEFNKRQSVHVVLSAELCLAHDGTDGFKRLVGRVVVVEQAQVVVSVLNRVMVQNDLASVVLVAKVNGQRTQGKRLTVASSKEVLQFDVLADVASNDVLVDAECSKDSRTRERDERVSLNQLEQHVNDGVTVDARRQDLERQTRETWMRVDDDSGSVLDERVQHLAVLERQRVEAEQNDASSNSLLLAVDDSRDEVALDGEDGTLPGLHRG